MKEVKAKKALGQHFLDNLDTAHRIAMTISEEELPAGSGYWGTLPVVEIGPGMGVLSRFLLEEGRRLKAVELDGESVVWLKKHLPQLEVVEGDFLKTDPASLWDEPMALIGNYPYNISSQIFFKVLENREKFPVVAGMLQKEVAERICARPGGRVRGILSVLLQAWYDCEYLFSVGPENFTPPPKVQSGVLRLTRNGRQSLGCDERLFKSVVKTAFGQRRKILRNSLSTLVPDRESEAGRAFLADELMMLRPERLDVEDFIRLTRSLQEMRGNIPVEEPEVVEDP